MKSNLVETLASNPYALPTRSALFSLPPRGLGTWKVESLFSFACRLAEAHGISMYGLQALIIKENLSKGINPSHKAHSSQCGFEGFSLLGPTARTWAKAINSLQRQNWADGTSLLSLEGRICTLHLSPKLRRYCPACQRADMGEGAAYEYLIWRFSAVNVCPEHACYLEIAPRESQHFHSRWLLDGKASPKTPGTESSIQLRQTFPNMDLELSRSRLIAELLESPLFRREKPTKEKHDTASFLQAIINIHMDGKAQSLSEYLQIDKGQISEWLNRKHIPSMDNIIDFAQAFSCSIASILSGDESAISMILPGYRRIREKNFRRGNHYPTNIFRDELKLVMLRNKAMGIHPSLTSIAKSLGVDLSSIQAAQPKLAKQIANNFEKSKYELTNLSRQIRDDAYRAAAVFFAKNGVIPTRRKVWKLLLLIPLVSMGDERRCQDICYEIRDKFGMKSRNKN